MGGRVSSTHYIRGHTYDAHLSLVRNTHFGHLVKLSDLSIYSSLFSLLEINL
jgi:hypothetical protein